MSWIDFGDDDATQVTLLPKRGDVVCFEFQYQNYKYHVELRKDKGMGKWIGEWQCPKDQYTKHPEEGLVEAFGEKIGGVLLLTGTTWREMYNGIIGNYPWTAELDGVK